MKRLISVITVLAMAAVFAGCISSGPVMSKSKLGNLEINVSFPQDIEEPNADIYLDGLFIGNVSPNMPVIYARTGDHTVRVVAPGCETYEKTITILGDPNHQVLNIHLRRK